ncbi:MAG: hypothetical protein WAL94_07350, partial [Bacteroidales bacterium]
MSGLEVSNTGFHVVKKLFDLVTRNFTAELFIALDEYALLLPCVNTRKVGSVDNALPSCPVKLFSEMLFQGTQKGSYGFGP